VLNRFERTEYSQATTMSTPMSTL